MTAKSAIQNNPQVTTINAVVRRGDHFPSTKVALFAYSIPSRIMSSRAGELGAAEFSTIDASIKCSRGFFRRDHLRNSDSLFQLGEPS